MKCYRITFILIFVSSLSFSQADVQKAKYFLDKGEQFDKENIHDSASTNFQKAGEEFWDLYQEKENEQYLRYYLYSIGNSAFHYNESEEFKQSIELIGKALANTSNIIKTNNKFYGNLYNDRGTAYKELKRFKKAEKDFKKCLNIQEALSKENQKLASIHYNLGEVSLKQGKYREAISHFEKDISLSSENNQMNPSDLLTTYKNLGVAFVKINKFSKAKECFSKIKEIASNLGLSSRELASTYQNIGLTLESLGNYKSALEYFHKANNLISGQNDSSLQEAEIFKNIGSIQSELGNYPEALKSYDNASKLIKDSGQEDLGLVAEIYNSKGRVFEKKGNYGKASNLYQKALSLLNENNLKTPAFHIMSYNNLGNISRITGKFNQSLNHYKKAAKLLKENQGEQNPTLAKTYGNIGNTYLNQGDFKRASEYMNRSFTIFSEIYPGLNHPDLITAYNNFGNLYNETGNYQKAIEYYDKDKELSEKFHGEESPEVAAAYNNIANVHSSQKQYERALEFYLKSKNIYSSAYGEEHPVLIGIYNNLGNIHQNKGDFESSLKYHSRAIKLKEQIFGEEHSGVASSYNNIGNSYFTDKKYDSAIVYYQKAIDISQELSGENHTLTARSNGNLANVFREKEDYEKAIQYYIKSLEGLKKAYGNTHPEIASTYNNLGHVAFDKNNYKEAAEFYQKSIVCNVSSYNDTTDLKKTPQIKNSLDQQTLLEALLNKSEALQKISGKQTSPQEKQRYKKAALAHYNLCDTLIREIRKEIHTEDDKLALSQKAYRLYKEAVNLTMERAKNAQNQKEREKFLKKAFSYSEKNKSKVLLQSISEANALDFAGIPKHMTKKEDSLKAHIASYREKLSKAEEEEKRAIRDKLFNAKRDYEELISNYEENYPEYYQLKHSSKVITTEQIQRNLEEESAFISYFVGDTSLCYFYISGDEFTGKQVKIPERFNDSIQHFRKSLVYKDSKNYQKHYNRLGYKLFTTIFPENIPGNINRLYIVPDAVLNTIPFETLLTEKVGADKENYTRFPYLIKKYNISYSYSATLFHELFREKSKIDESINDYEWLGIAPVFSNKTQKALTLTSDENGQKQTEKKMKNKKTSWKVNGEIIQSLPDSEKEIESIFQHFKEKKKPAMAKIHRSATEEFIKSTDLNTYGIIHFATHGIINSEKPDKSGMVFSDGSNSSEDGLLQTKEIYNLSFNSKLINLSACETGLGKMKKGEGIMGLTRAMLYAGNQNIIVSLWKVSDVSTHKLMVNFYDNQLDQEHYNHFGESLREAKLSMIEDEKFAHPFYWAPFTLIGK
ncbi:MAG: CHAT domain-containing protein [Bacteroidota bacterium]